MCSGRWWARTPRFGSSGPRATPSRRSNLVLREQPDVVLLDVRMPGGGGPHAAREISKRSPHTKIVALSAHDDADTVIGMIAPAPTGTSPRATPTDKILRTIHRTATGGVPPTAPCRT